MADLASTVNSGVLAAVSSFAFRVSTSIEVIETSAWSITSDVSTAPALIVDVIMHRIMQKTGNSLLFFFKGITSTDLSNKNYMQAYLSYSGFLSTTKIKIPGNMGKYSFSISGNLFSERPIPCIKC